MAFQFQYIAYNDDGKVVKGKLEAASQDAANDLLSYAGYKAVSIREFVPFFSTENFAAGLFPTKPEEIVLLYRELATLLESGISIVMALELLRDQSTNKNLKKVLTLAIADLRSGNPLSSALGKHPKVFSTIYCRLIAVGERSGNLETVLRQIADYMEKESNTTKNVKGALTYPITTFVVAMVVVGLLISYVLPAFGKLYGSLGIELPLATRIMIGIGDFGAAYGTWGFLGVFIALACCLMYFRTPQGRFKFDGLLLKLPVIGRVNHLTELGRYCRSMSLLFKAGLPLTEVLSQTIQGSNNRVLAKAMTTVQEEMVRGEGISAPMGRNPLFLPMMVQMIRVGEETGNLDQVLLTVSRSFETEAEDKTRALVAMIQPAMTLFVGLIIGAVALSMTSAMYSMYGQAF